MMPLSVIRQLTGLTGLDVAALRRYERMGLLTLPVNRDRRAATGERDWLRQLASLSLAGLPDAAIRRLADLERRGIAGIGLRRRILDSRAGDIDRKLSMLEETLQLIRQELGGVTPPGSAWP